MNSSRVFRALLAPASLLVLVGGASPSLAFDGEGRGGLGVSAPRAAVVGSSSVKGVLGRLIESELERKGYSVDRLGVVGAGLARPDYRDMHALVAKVPIDADTAAVFIYLGVNDAQSIRLLPEDRQTTDQQWLKWNDPRWSVVYRRRAQRLFESLCRRGARHVIVMLPVEVMKPRLERRLRRIRALQRQAAERVSCATAISTVRDGAELIADEPTRRKDGIHLTKEGARRVWERVKRRAALALPSAGRWAR